MSKTCLRWMMEGLNDNTWPVLCDLRVKRFTITSGESFSTVIDRRSGFCVGFNSLGSTTTRKELVPKGFRSYSQPSKTVNICIATMPTRLYVHPAGTQNCEIMQMSVRHRNHRNHLPLIYMIYQKTDETVYFHMLLCGKRCIVHALRCNVWKGALMSF